MVGFARPAGPFPQILKRIKIMILNMRTRIGLLFLSIVHAILCNECDQLSSKAELDLKQMEGWWHLQYKSSPDDSKDMFKNYKCVMQNWTPIPDGSVRIVQIGLNISEPRTSKGMTMIISGHRKSTDGNIQTHGWYKGNEFSVPIKLIETDYKNYMVSAACSQDYSFTWIFTRKIEKMTEDDIKAVQPMLESTKLNIDSFKPELNDMCP